MTSYKIENDAIDHFYAKETCFGKFQGHKLVNKQLQWTYCPIFHEAKVTRQGNLVSQENITREIFLSKDHEQNEAGRLDPDLFWFSKRALYEVKASGLQLSFNIYLTTPNLASRIYAIKMNFIEL